MFQAFVNIPALSERTIRRDIASSDFTTGPEIQVCLEMYVVCIVHYFK